MWGERPVVVLVRTMREASAPLSAALWALTLVQGILPVVFVWVSGSLVGSVPAAVAGGPGSAAGDRLVSLLLLAAGLFVIQQLIAPFAELIARSVARKVDRLVRSRTMQTMATPAGISHLEDPALQDFVLVARGVSGGDMTCGMAVMGLSGIVATMLTGAGATALVLSWNVWIGGLLVGTWLAIRTHFRRDLMRVAEILMGKARGLRRSQYFRDIVLQPGVAKELRVFGLRPLFRARFDQAWTDAMGEVWRGRRKAMVPIFIATGLLFVVYGLSIWMIGDAFRTGSIDLAALSILLSASLQVATLGNISNHDFFLANGLPALKALAVGERRVQEAAAAVPAGGSSVSPTAPERAIRFEGVGFSYPGNPMRIYNDLTLEIPVGGSLAIVGANGAGKTTLVKLLARLYDPSEGRITVDGTDLRAMDPAAWQRRIAAIFQDFVQYPLSARDNLALGGLGLADDDGALRNAADLAGALEILDGLPDGWSTPLSRQFEGGAELSGGQWQRIALARAMVAVAAGAGVLVLDEPTANLDVRAEAALFDRFLDLTEGLTTILVSHRFSTVRRADRICVLDGGRVTELGSHDELLALGGTYARMFTLQASRFFDEEAAT